MGDVLDDLRRHGEQYSDYEIQYAYVVSDTGKLVGVLRLRDLLMAPKQRPISDVMVKDPLNPDGHPKSPTYGHLKIPHPSGLIS